MRLAVQADIPGPERMQDGLQIAAVFCKGATHAGVGIAIASTGRGHVHRKYQRAAAGGLDRKSTRLNSSHVRISCAVFCLKKKKISTTAMSRPFTPTTNVDSV